MKKFLLPLLGLIGAAGVWLAFLIYFGLWGKIFRISAKVFHSDDPFGWSGVVAMLVVITGGKLIYEVIRFVIERMRRQKI